LEVKRGVNCIPCSVAKVSLEKGEARSDVVEKKGRKKGGRFIVRMEKGSGKSRAQRDGVTIIVALGSPKRESELRKRRMQRKCVT